MYNYFLIGNIPCYFMLSGEGAGGEYRVFSGEAEKSGVPGYKILLANSAKGDRSPFWKLM